MIDSPQQAADAAIRHLGNPSWEPAVTEVVDAGVMWRVFYNSRAYVETGSVSHALAGNLPLLVDKATGSVASDCSYLPRWKALVRLRLLPGGVGRSKPIGSGYRPTWRSARKPELNDAAVDLEGQESLMPGGECEAWLRPAMPHLWAGLILAGDTLYGTEGNKVVAEAVVQEVDLWQD